MRKRPRFRPLVALCTVFCALALSAPAVRAQSEFLITEYRLVDASSIWVRNMGLWSRVNLAWVDTTEMNANRPLSYRLELPMSYLKLRIEWVRMIRQIEAFREPSLDATRRILEGGKDLKWILRPEAGPIRKADLQRTTVWGEVKVDGKDLGTMLVEQGWAIPFVPPGVEEPANWREMQEKLQESMSECRGMWQMLLQQCFIESQKPKEKEK